MELIEEKRKKIYSLDSQIRSLEFEIKEKQKLLSDMKLRRTKTINEYDTLCEGDEE